MNCSKCYPKPPTLVWMEVNQSRQTSNGFLIAKVPGWYCPRCAGCYGGNRRVK